MFVDSQIDAETVDRPRVLAIVLAGFVGFLAGQILGSVFELIGTAVTHYPGGLSALGNNPSPPWWAWPCRCPSHKPPTATTGYT